MLSQQIAIMTLADESTHEALPATLSVGKVKVEGPTSIKERLAQLDGKFPMCEAVVEGESDFTIKKS
jgi:hypothetical protein